MMWKRVAPATAGRAGATAALVLLLAGCAGSLQHLGSYGATCTSNQTDGSFKCLCDTGLEVDGYSCLDFDECVNNLTLCGNGVCVDTPGGYDCVCDDGFIPSASLDGKSCVDMDECAPFENICMVGRCENTSGTFKCTCDKGHQSESMNDFTVFHAFSCKDVDECKSPQSCRNGQCINTLGSYMCKCPSNYKLISNGIGTTCKSNANTNYTLITISSISAPALLLLLFIVMRKRCWIKDNQPGTLQLQRNEHRNPFYTNLLFREECSREIAEIEQQHYDEVGEHDYEEIAENAYDEIEDRTENQIIKPYTLPV